MGQVASKGTGSQQPAGTEGPKPSADNPHRQSYVAAQLTLQVLQGKKQFMKEFRLGISTDLVRGGTPASPSLGIYGGQAELLPPRMEGKMLKTSAPSKPRGPSLTRL